MNPLSSITKNITTYALLVLLSLASHSALHTRMSYQDIGNMYLPSLGVVEKEGTSDNVEEAEEAGPSLDVKELSQHERLTKTFELLAQCEDTTDQDITVNHLLRELEFFYGHNDHPEKSTFSYIDRTTTSFGEAMLAHRLANPTTDTVLIQKRQKLVKYLLANKNLRADIEEILNQILANESAFLTNWKKDDKLTQEFIKSLYFGDWISGLNTKQSALELRVHAKELFYTFPLISELFTLPWIVDSFTENKGFIHSTKSTFRGLRYICNPYNYSAIKNKASSFLDNIRQGEAQRILNSNPNISQTEALCKAQSNTNTLIYTLIGSAIALCAIKGVQAYQVSTLLSQEHKGHTYLQTKLLGLSRILNAAERIDCLIDAHPELNNGLIHGDTIQNLLYYNDNTDLKSFVSTLRTRTFKGDPSSFSRMGRVLATAKQAEKIKNGLVPLIEMIGELDACLSIAKLMEEHEASDAHYCFVEFEQKETPYLHLQEFWHPFIGKDNAVTNSIELGAENKERNVILTGSNTGGKSTLLKAVGINLLFAHTIGIVPSSSAAITPFELISTSLNLSDNTAAGISLFKAEVLRAKDIMNQVSSLPDNAHAFLIIDEMFTGTNAKNGADAALSFAKKIADYCNIMYMFATHFPLVTTLGNENNTCANYCMDIYKDEDGSLHPTYTITPGISTQNVAEDILEEELGDYS